ncbi:MAG: hypothetical protein ABIT37_01585 [Luteolibacter sp.]
MTLPIAYIPTPEFWALCTLITGGFGKFIWDQFKRVQDRKDAAEAKEQARLDLQQLLELTKAGFEVTNENGQTRLKQIMQSNVTTRQYTKKAIDTSNGIKTALMEKGVKLVTDDEKSTTLETQ